MTKLKNRKSVCTTIDKNIYIEFKKLSTQTKIPMTKLHDEALNDLATKYSQKVSKIQISQ